MMVKLSYKLTESVDSFEEGDVLELTAQYGDWHPADVKLEPDKEYTRKSIELTWDELRAVSVPPEAPA
jgi:hypothetical protein